MTVVLQLELFRELQLLTSDYLRQRALYALQELVTRFLTEDSVGAEGGALQQQVRIQKRKHQSALHSRE